MKIYFNWTYVKRSCYDGQA